MQTQQQTRGRGQTRPAPGQAIPQGQGNGLNVNKRTQTQPGNGNGNASKSANQSSLVVYETNDGQKIQLSPAIVKRYLVSGDADRVTDQEVMMFLALCKYQKLNPFIREAYLIKFGNEPASLVTGKDVFTKRASNNPNCDGWEAGVIILDADGNLAHRNGTLVLPNETLVGGWAKVYRKDWSIPFETVVSMDEYMRRKKDGTPMANWRTMPATMIRKVALSQALRETFTGDYQGMYSEEEMPVDSEALNRNLVNVSEAEYEEQNYSQMDTYQRGAQKPNMGQPDAYDGQTNQGDDTQPVNELPPEPETQHSANPEPTPREKVYIMAQEMAEAHNLDPKKYQEAVNATIIEAMGVDSIDKVKPAQWRGIAKNVDGLMQQAKKLYETPPGEQQGADNNKDAGK